MSLKGGNRRRQVVGKHTSRELWELVFFLDEPHDCDGQPTAAAQARMDKTRSDPESTCLLIVYSYVPTSQTTTASRIKFVRADFRNNKYYIKSNKIAINPLLYSVKKASRSYCIRVPVSLWLQNPGRLFWVVYLVYESLRKSVRSSSGTPWKYALCCTKHQSAFDLRSINFRSATLRSSSC